MKDNFDDIIKRKWEAKQFPVDESHRADMIRLLDQQRKRRGVFFWWLGSALVVFIAISMFVLSFQKNNDQTASALKSSASKGHNVDHAHMNESATPSANEINEAENHEGINSNPTSYERANEGKLSIPPNDIKGIEKDNNAVFRSTRPNRATKTIPSQQTNQPGDQSKQRKPEMAMIDNGKMENETQKPQPIKNTTISNEHKDESSFQIASEEFEVREAIVVTAIEVLSVNDMDLPEREIAPGIKPAHTYDHPLVLFADAGIGYIPPSFPDIKSGWSIELGGGISYGLLKTTNVFLAGGYFLQKGGFNFQRTSTTNQPGFGTRSASNTLTPDKLHFVYTKIGIEQKFRRHSFTGALALQWLYGAQGMIDMRTQDQFAQTPVEENTYSWLVLDGMQRLLWAGEFDYGYQLYPKWKLSLGVKHYFSKLANDDTSLPDQGYYWWGRLAPLNPSITVQYRIYGK